MINKGTIDHLSIRLPLLTNRISEEQMSMLFHKWGGTDGEYHSSKSVIKKFGTKMSEKEVKDLETSAIAMIEEEMEIIYRCPNCNVDIRKCGVTSIKTGFETETMYIAADGSPTRVNDKRFDRQQFNGQRPIVFKCHDCGAGFSDDNHIVMFLGRGISRELIYDYLERFKGNKPNKNSKLKKKVVGMPIEELTDEERLIHELEMRREEVIRQGIQFIPDNVQQSWGPMPEMRVNVGVDIGSGGCGGANTGHATTAGGTRIHEEENEAFA